MQIARPRKPRLSNALALTLLLGFATGVLGGALRTASAHSYTGQVSVVAGVSGSVTTLECYGVHSTRAHHHYPTKPDPFAPCDTGVNPHSYTFANPVDIGTSGGTPSVYAQVDYLPSGVAGGYVAGWRIDTYCAAYDPEDDEYNGRKIGMRFYYYDEDSELFDYNTVLYQHVDENEDLVGPNSNNPVWTHWNNATGNPQLWPGYVEDYTLNDGTSGGGLVGSVAEIGGGVPSSCATAEHLHQEGYGSYNYFRFYLESVSGRISDLHFVSLAGITSTKP